MNESVGRRGGTAAAGAQAMTVLRVVAIIAVAFGMF